MSKGEGLKIGIRFTEEILGNLSGNLSAFSITGKERKYINGPLIDGDYQIESIANHPSEEKSLLITMKALKGFNNVEGKIKVEYDATKGSLTGAGGAVESFEVQFNPADLVQTPNPGIQEYLKAYPYAISLALNDWEYVKGYDTAEYLKAYPYAIVLDLKDVVEINP